MNLNDGARAELYVKQFAKDTRIASNVSVSPENVIKLLNQFNQHNLTWARMYLEQRPEIKPYPYVNDWIDRVLDGQKFSEPVSNDFKETVKENLLDTAFSSDLFVQVNDNKGQPQKIAIDVTVKQTDQESKLRKIRGQREDGNTSKKFNPNQKYSMIRQRLGVDKHIVLVLDARFYPSYETLLKEIYTAANSHTRTMAVNLCDHQEIDSSTIVLGKTSTPQIDPKQVDSKQMWQEFSRGIRSSDSIEQGIQASIKAIRAGYRLKDVDNMLKQTQQYNRLFKNNPKAAENYLQLISEETEQRIEQQNKRGISSHQLGSSISNTSESRMSISEQKELNQKALKAGLWIASTFGKNRENGEKTLTTKSYRFTLKDNYLQITPRQSDSAILELSNKKLIGTVTQQDVEKLEAVAQKLQQRLFNDLGQRRSENLDLER
jgi:hypothetical protein